MRKALVVGGSNGIGLALVNLLLNKGYSKIIIADKEIPAIEDTRIAHLKINLTECDFEVFEQYQDIDTLIVTAGFGRLAEFKTTTAKEIENSFKVNAISVISIIKKYYERLMSDSDFDCVVMGSIAGWVCSPLYAVYSATKSALCKFLEAINIELEKSNSLNRVLNVSPGSLKGTRFHGEENQISLLDDLAEEIFSKMKEKCELFIPDYDSIYKNVIERYISDPHKFGIESYEYKVKNNRINPIPKVKIGYLSGTFDLFHIGHLNLLKRAKQYCDYLVVAVHKDASHKGKQTFIPFEERCEILKSIKLVDKVITALPEDTDVYGEIKYNYLFVGSDYKGTDRFKRYEEFFEDKDVEIIYFPYTEGTSSTQIRDVIDKNLRGE